MTAALAIAAAALAATGTTTPDAGADVKGADPALLQTARSIGEKTAQILSMPAPVSWLALRADDATRAAAARARAERALPPATAAARGRAWSDLGFGGADDPSALALALAVDLPGMTLDADGSRLLIDPSRLGDDAGTAGSGDDLATTLLLATGVAPDEPVVAHYAAHRAAPSSEPSEPPTTDAALARAAMGEGVANVAALVFLFSGAGLEAEVLDGKLLPDDVIGGRLVSEAIRSPRPVVAGLVDFVYLDGFVAAAQLAKRSGVARLPAEAARRGTTRDVLHPDRSPLGPIEPPGRPVGESLGLAVVDRDSLGEQGIVSWVARATGKDNLGLIAGDGWSGDSVLRLEPRAPASPPGAGVTLWTSQWATEEDAKDFVYCVERALGARFPVDKLVDAPDGGKILTRSDRVFRLRREDKVVIVRVAPPDWDAKLEGDVKKKGSAPRARTPGR